MTQSLDTSRIRHSSGRTCAAASLCSSAVIEFGVSGVDGGDVWAGGAGGDE